MTTSTTEDATKEPPVEDATTTEAVAADDDTNSKRKRESVPDKGYTCNICKEGGHWIQQCPQRKNKKKKNKDHTPVEGVDPSKDDIEKAKEMQKLRAPPCYCGVTSRVKKVKQSKYNPNSRAIGLYFFFCAKKDKEECCRFAKPVVDEDDHFKNNKVPGRHVAPQHPSREGASTGPPKRLCMFYAKNKSCKKGDACMFSHEVAAKPYNLTTF
jgi:hypothetical protein